jgi:hypothetical protein
MDDFSVDDLDLGELGLDGFDGGAPGAGGGTMSMGNLGLASALQRCGAPLTLSDYTLAAGTLVVAPRLALIGVCGDATGTNARQGFAKVSAAGEMAVSADLNAFAAPGAVRDLIYDFDEALTPAVSDMAPLLGSSAGGTTVTLNGHGFGVSPNVTIAGIVCAWRYEDIGYYRGKHLCEWGQEAAGGVNCSGIGANVRPQDQRPPGPQGRLVLRPPPARDPHHAQGHQRRHYHHARSGAGGADGGGLGAAVLRGGRACLQERLRVQHGERAHDQP